MEEKIIATLMITIGFIWVVAIFYLMIKAWKEK